MAYSTLHAQLPTVIILRQWSTKCVSYDDVETEQSLSGCTTLAEPETPLYSVIHSLYYVAY